MIAIAVMPIATPIKTRRRSGLAIARCNGEPGCSKSITNTPALIMNTPNPDASIRYSGQCWQSVARTSTISASRCEFGVEGHAAVDEQRDTVDIIAGIRCQPDRGAGDVFG